MKYFLILTSLFFLNGCTSVFKVKNVKAWEKETLAKETMTLSGGNTLFYKYQKHIFFSKEASKGGGGVAGGGCGCN